ncbi:hypothetical protein BSPWISOXPB_4416 [uncultured Gammaproteobacteria bacterium]|nr:hypothetical protein BSPWISOXPB_4416 [uncultured Gammaproteobacteria bacterium]
MRKINDGITGKSRILSEIKTDYLPKLSFTKNQMDAKKLRKIEIKPLSINKAWKGRRFKTKEHVNYCKRIELLLPNDILSPQKLIYLLNMNLAFQKHLILTTLKKYFKIYYRKNIISMIIES